MYLQNDFLCCVVFHFLAFYIHLLRLQRPSEKEMLGSRRITKIAESLLACREAFCRFCAGEQVGVRCVLRPHRPGWWGAADISASWEQVGVAGGAALRAQEGTDRLAWARAEGSPRLTY